MDKMYNTYDNNSSMGRIIENAIPDVNVVGYGKK
jgi:hypothetical protein